MLILNDISANWIIKRDLIEKNCDLLIFFEMSHIDPLILRGTTLQLLVYIS